MKAMSDFFTFLCKCYQGRRKAREANKHFGAPGLPNTHAKPFVREKSRNHEQARGRRKSRNYKA